MKRRGLSPDERVLWSAVTRSIAPMRAGAAAPEEDAVEAVRPAATKSATKAPLARPLAQEPMPPPLSAARHCCA